jgi:hypothetical protein
MLATMSAAKNLLRKQFKITLQEFPFGITVSAWKQALRLVDRTPPQK